jgi:enamine deaminase RidA (YjgF/YER057c/UK114 family)
MPTMADIKIYNVESLGKPVGPYSHVARVKSAETLYIAGMLSPGDTFEKQCAAVFGQVGQALKSAGAGWANVVQFTTFLVHSQDIAAFYRWREQNYPRMFPDGKYPPNTLLIIDRLVQEQFLIEVQTIAAL